MFYSQDQSDRIREIQKAMRSGEKHDVSLCQYNDLSCVRCCLPHIGGDSDKEHTIEDYTELFNKDNLGYRLKYGDRFVGPHGLLMKFRNINPLKEPGIEVSHYEDSFEDVGQKEMEKRFRKRSKLFQEIYDLENPEESLREYEKKIKELENYQYKPNEGEGFGALFCGGSIPQKGRKGNELPQCQMLGFLDEDENKVGCLAEPRFCLSEKDLRDKVGFFKGTESCDGCSCEAAKDFPYLSDSARKVFDKAISGMSWYDYSRHSTSVMVYYLGAFDHVFQKMDERGILNNLSLEKIVEFTNELYDDWPLREPRYDISRKTKDLRIPKFPILGEFGKSKIEWMFGTKEEHEKVKNIKDWGESYLAREKISKEIPYTLTATEEGYEFDFNFDDERKKIQVEIVDGNKPILKGELVGDLWRHGVNYQIHEKHGDNIQNRGECNLLRIITRKFDYWHPKIKNGETCSGDLGRHKLLTHESLSFAEAKTYAGLNSWIHPDVMDVQLKRAREHIDKKIDELVVEVGEEQVD